MQGSFTVVGSRLSSPQASAHPPLGLFLLLGALGWQCVYKCCFSGFRWRLLGLELRLPRLHNEHFAHWAISATLNFISPVVKRARGAFDLLQTRTSFTKFYLAQSVKIQEHLFSTIFYQASGLKQNRHTPSMTARCNWAREVDSHPQFKFFVQEVIINLARIVKGSTASLSNGQSGCRKSQPKTKTPAKL